MARAVHGFVECYQTAQLFTQDAEDLSVVGTEISGIYEKPGSGDVVCG